MNKLLKISLILGASIFSTIGHAASPAELKGVVPQSAACNSIQAGGRQVGMVLLMPNQPGGPLQIKSTQGFALKQRTTLPYYSVGANDESHCNYYMNPTSISIAGQSRVLERLLVNSVYNTEKSLCMQVTAGLEIATPNGSTCVIAMKQ